MPFARRLVASATSLALLGSMLTSGVTAGNPDTTAGWLPEIRDSRAIDGPPVVRGRLIDSRGRGVPDGRLTLLAWPLADVLENTQPGDGVKLLPVGKAVTAHDGSFAVRIEAAAPLFEITAPDGLVNFDLVGQSPTGFAVFSFPSRFEGSAWKALDAESGSDVLDVEVALEEQPVVAGSDSAPIRVADKFCISTVKATWDLRQHIVGEVYTGPSTRAEVVYSAGSSSTVGVGYSVSGSFGSWSQRGTASTSSTYTENFPWQYQWTNRDMRTHFGWKKYKLECWERGTYWSWHETRPYQFQGGQVMRGRAAPSATYCVGYSAGGGMTRSSGAAYTFRTGVKISAVLGIDLSTRTGWNTNTQLTYEFLASGRLCGTNAYPGAAKRLVAKGPA
jgi:hypothetical protein